MMTNLFRTIACYAAEWFFAHSLYGLLDNQSLDRL